MRNKTLVILSVVFIAATAARAQVASNAPYVLEQAVIASGGGQNSTGGAFSVDGTIGQSIAGASSTNSPYNLKSGFWTAPAAPPTAASVAIGGRVLTPDGRGLRNARVSLTDAYGSSQTVLTGAFGYYRFAEVVTGQTVVITVVSKRYQFLPQIVTVTEEFEELNFTAVSPGKYQVEP